jgi:hypothetical protein
MTAPAGATSLPTRIRAKIDEIAAGHTLCGYVEDALC